VTWYEFILPAVFIALVVRMEAKLIGPYWSWLELIPLVGDEGSPTARKRRGALLRRLAIPGLTTFILGTSWSDEYSFLDAVIVALSGAGLLLWPFIFAPLPYGVSTRRLAAIYSALLVGFGATGWIGRYIAEFALTDDGIGKFLQENLISLIVGGVITAFAVGIFDSASSRASKAVADADADAE
jgi:hypothetical protein